MLMAPTRRLRAHQNVHRVDLGPLVALLLRPLHRGQRAAPARAEVMRGTHGTFEVQVKVASIQRSNCSCPNFKAAMAVPLPSCPARKLPPHGSLRRVAGQARADAALQARQVLLLFLNPRRGSTGA